MGDSSGGWTSAMAAVTGDVPEMEGRWHHGRLSRVQAAVAFYPPTNFLTMDAWALRSEVRGSAFCHDAEGSPESRLVGCAIQTCPDKVQAASPLQLHHRRRSAHHDPARQLRSARAAQPGRAAVHGAQQGLQGRHLHQPAEGAPRELERLPDRRRPARGGDDASTSAAGCAVVNPTPYTPTWKTVIGFLDKYMK